jgi:hypothetical protein
MDSRKQAVSIRMSAGDIRNIKKLAKRLGVRDSDVIRLAVKSMLAKLGPLNDSSVRGRSLVPVFVESGIDIFRYLEVDPVRLEAIINGGVEAGSRVDEEDIQLIAMNGIQQSYAKLRLSSISGRNGAPQREAAAEEGEGDNMSRTLRRYLYDKYVYTTTPADSANPGDPAKTR